MRFSEWLRLAEVHLYHGTVVDNEDSIRLFGLQPDVGDFVRSAYELGDSDSSDSERFEPLVFAAEKRELGRALTAMVHHIASKLGKSFHAVTDLDIRNHGLLVRVADGGDSFRRRGEEDWGHPGAVEPGDYYSDYRVHPTALIKGPGLIRLLTRYGVLPRTWGPEGSGDKLRGLYGAMAIRQYGRDRRPDILRHIAGIPIGSVRAQINRSRE